MVKWGGGEKKKNVCVGPVWCYLLRGSRLGARRVPVPLEPQSRSRRFPSRVPVRVHLIWAASIFTLILEISTREEVHYPTLTTTLTAGKQRKNPPLLLQTPLPFTLSTLRYIKVIENKRLHFFYWLLHRTIAQPYPSLPTIFINL